MTATRIVSTSRLPSDERLRSLLEEYGELLRRVIRRLAPQGLDHDLDDIEQEAKVRLWRALQKRTAIDKPASYIYRVAANATLDALSRYNGRREQPLETAAAERWKGETASPERAAMGKQMIGSVGQAMARLQPDRRRAVGLHLQGFTIAEIAEFYGWSEPKARNLAYRGLWDLRRQLKMQPEQLEPVEAI